MALFKQSQFSKIQSSIYTTNLVQNINGNQYDIPHIIFPGYSYQRNTSFLDAVALIGIQKELMYNQNLENIHYNNPYLEQKHLLTSYKKSQASDEESVWKNQSYYYSRDINCQGHIVRITSDRDNILVLTDEYEIVLLDKYLSILYKQDLQEQIEQLKQNYNITKILDAQLSLYDEWNIVGLIKIRSEKQNIYLTFNLDQNKIYSFNYQIIQDDDLLVGEKSAMFVSATNDLQSYKVLSQFLSNYKPEQKQSTNYYQIQDYIYYQTPLVIILSDIKQNKSYSYLKKRGVIVSAKQEGKLDFVYPSASLLTKQQIGKVDIFSQTLDIDKLQSSLNYVTKISTQNSVVEANQDVDLSTVYASDQIVFEPLTTVISTKPVDIFITPLGHLTMINQNNGKRLFITQIPQQDSNQNCQLKLLTVNNNSIISVQIQRQTYLYNLNNGKLIAEMQIPEEQQLYLQDPLQNDWSEITQELNSNIFSTKMSAFSNEEVIINVRSTLMDVIGVASQEGDLFSSYITRVLMILFIGCILLAGFNIIKEKKYISQNED